MSRWTKVLSPIAVTLALGSAAALAQTPGVTDTEVKVGAFGPLTGPVYMYGKLTMNGVDAYFDKVNKEGGVHGRKLVLVREDDSCKPENAIAAVRKLAHDHQVFGIVGGACSNATIAATPELEKAGLPTIINSAVADSITDPVKPNIFTAMLTASIESRAQLQYAIDQGAKKIAVISQRDAWGRARIEPLMDAVKKKGIQLAADIEVAPEANDATAQALQLKASGADAIVMVLYPKPGAVAIRDSLKIGYKPLWIGQTAINDMVAFKDQVGIPGALEKVVTISTVRFQPTDPEVKEWADRVKALFPNDNLSTFNLNGIGSAMVFTEVLKQTGRDVTREKFIKTIGQLKGFDAFVYGGPISCNSPETHQCLKTVNWVGEKDGGFKVIGTTTVQ